MAYSASYDTADLDDIIVDFVGTYLAQIVIFAGLIALAVIGVWFMKKARGFGAIGGK